MRLSTTSTRPAQLRRRIGSVAAAAALAALMAPVAAASGGAGLPSGDGSTQAPPSASGGAAPGAPAPTPASRRATSHTPVKTTTGSPKPPAGAPHGRWFHGVTVTEYWPAPESWFVGALVQAPGLPGLHRIDWLYSAQGVSMEGEGVGLDGKLYHIDSLGDGGWVTADGHPTIASRNWLGGAPYWRAGGYWANSKKAVTFPLQSGGWSNGQGRHYVPLPNVTFAPGPSLPVRFLQSIAVDPRVIPLGSRVYIPAYKNDGHGGWFLAQDTGGAIKGRHVDVYRQPPPSPTDSGNLLTSQPVFVVPPARSAGA